MSEAEDVSAHSDPALRLVGSERVPAVLIELAEHPHGIGLDEMKLDGSAA
ncbi:MAG: hypothetical protein WKF57_18210 [Nakamurella sp.]